MLKRIEQQKHAVWCTPFTNTWTTHCSRSLALRLLKPAPPSLYDVNRTYPQHRLIANRGSGRSM